LDYAEAYKWYLLAAAQGNSPAKRALNALATIMTPKQLGESESRVADWNNQHKILQSHSSVESGEEWIVTSD
jgi:TPR repeat protein